MAHTLADQTRAMAHPLRPPELTDEITAPHQRPHPRALLTQSRPGLAPQPRPGLVPQSRPGLARVLGTERARGCPRPAPPNPRSPDQHPAPRTPHPADRQPGRAMPLPARPP
ncbi:hypothetical protein [Streptomyces sp. NPDC057302]|uniref:hypothetical protein n=1 Tax=Streptomyces sp. NPDC057302 TaxID=3346094 RepID=UPI00363CBF5D